ncbi:MAG: response regulator transcription factor [Bacteroidales bacterium]|nr:response regulator transcription factor [Bacteroidales bacterium]
MKILVIEDELGLLETITSFLKEEGFVCEKAASYFVAEDKLAAFVYDIVVIDINLPDGSGLSLLEKIKKQHPETGTLIVSAKNSLDDKIKGLDLGADDYITKPFHLSELNSRIRAVLRRRKFQGSQVLDFQEIRLFPEERAVYINDNLLNLTSKEYELLLFFITNKERVHTRQSIAEHLWGDYMDTADRFDFVYTHLNNLRKKIKSAGGSDYISSVYGIGYKFSSQ